MKKLNDDLLLWSACVWLYQCCITWFPLHSAHSGVKCSRFENSLAMRSIFVQRMFPLDYILAHRNNWHQSSITLWFLLEFSYMHEWRGRTTLTCTLYTRTENLLCFALSGKGWRPLFWVCFCIAVYLYFCFGWVHEHTHTQNKNAAQFHCIRFLLLFALMCNTHRNFPFRRIKFRFCNSILFYSIGNFGTNTHSIFQQFIYAITWDDVLVEVKAATAAAAVTRICVSELNLVWNISLLLADYVVLILCVFTLC